MSFGSNVTIYKVKRSKRIRTSYTSFTSQTNLPLDTTADIAILTEYVANKNDTSEFGKNLSSNGYSFSSSQTDQNGILIAVKNNCFIKDFAGITSIKESNINIHSVAIKLNGEIITIIGTIIIPENNGQLRYKQLKTLLDYIDSLETPYSQRIIVAGNFNNYLIIGDENNYNSSLAYGPDASCYNIQFIKKLFLEKGFEVQNSTPSGNIITISHMYMVALS